MPNPPCPPRSPEQSYDPFPPARPIDYVRFGVVSPGLRAHSWAQAIEGGDMTGTSAALDGRETDNDLLDIAPVAGRIGAEIHGVRLGGDLDDATIDAIMAA